MKKEVIKSIEIKHNGEVKTVEFFAPRFTIGPQSSLGDKLLRPATYNVKELDEKNEEHAMAVAYLVKKGIGDIGKIASKEAKEVQLPEGKPTDKWTVAQLELWMTESNVEFDSNDKKSDLLAKIEESQKSE